MPCLRRVFRQTVYGHKVIISQRCPKLTQMIEDADRNSLKTNANNGNLPEGDRHLTQVHVHGTFIPFPNASSDCRRHI